jgi:hypothetical protein
LDQETYLVLKKDMDDLLSKARAGATGSPVYAENLSNLTPTGRPRNKRIKSALETPKSTKKQK